ncbi:hypothetical protein R5R35_001228 [Gryllus longicercus]|uniref:Uncharacterized protein n=1 Tax=Gryllus longicercus TaxID=2509291 RepID=A0AAN9YT09_9ORTH
MKVKLTYPFEKGVTLNTNYEEHDELETLLALLKIFREFATISSPRNAFIQCLRSRLDKLLFSGFLQHKNSVCDQGRMPSMNGFHRIHIFLMRNFKWRKYEVHLCFSSSVIHVCATSM